MIQLTDLYKRETNSDLLALTNIGKRISGNRKLSIFFRTSEIAFTDGNIIHLPQKFQNRLKVAQGFVAHEAGHQGYGSFELSITELINTLSVKHNLPKTFVKHVINIIEDVRINSINKRKFPGFYENLRDYTIQILPNLKQRIRDQQDIFVYINLFMEDYQDFQSKPVFSRINFTFEDWDKIAVMKASINRTPTTNMSIIISDQLCKLLSEYFIFVKKDPRSPYQSQDIGNIDDPRAKRGIVIVENPEKNYNYKGTYINRDPIIEEIGLNHFDDFEDKNGEISKKTSNFLKQSEEMIKKIKLGGLEVEKLETMEKIMEKIVPIEKEEEFRISKEIEDMNDVMESLEELDNPRFSKKQNSIKKEKITQKIEKIKKEKEEQKQKIMEEHQIKREKIEKLVNELDQFTSIKEGDDRTKQKEKIVEDLKKISEEQLTHLNHDDFNDKKEIDTIEKLINQIEEDFNVTDEPSRDRKRNYISQLESLVKRDEERAKNKIEKVQKEISNFTKLTEEIKEVLNCKDPEINKTKKKEILSKMKEHAENLELRKLLGWNAEDLSQIAKDNGIMDITRMILEADKKLDERLSAIERGVVSGYNPNIDEERETIETKIEEEHMKPINLGYKDILQEYKSLINKLKLIFKNFNNSVVIDKSQKRGRLNKKFIKTVMSDYRYKKCFTKKMRNQVLKIILLVDISGSMGGNRIEAAKISMIMLVEALTHLAEIRIILFTGNKNARNIIVKDFGERLDSNKIDKVGLHQTEGSTLDGVSLLHESSKYHGNEIFIVISDGQPSAPGYGIHQSMQQFQEVRKRFKVFGFSIDARGDYLDKQFGKNWILTNSENRTNLGEKIVMFCRFIVKEFYR